MKRRRLRRQGAGRLGVSLAFVTSLLSARISAGAESENPVTAAEEQRSTNTVAFFVGIAHEGPRDNGLALGVEYERRFAERFGIGALAEHTFGDIDTWVYAVSFAYHTRRWKLYLAPGIEDSVHSRESLLRIGAERGFEIGTWEIAPQLDVDLVDSEEIYVLGVTFGRGF